MRWTGPNSWILFFGKSFISSNRISRNDQRIVKVWIIGIIPTFYPESISQTSSHIQFWCNITINVPDKSIRWHSCNSGIAFWTSGWSQAGIKGSKRVIQMPMRTPSLDWCGPKRIFKKMNKAIKSKIRNNTPCWSVSIFENSSWKNQVGRTGFLACKNPFRNWFLYTTQAVKIKLEID